MNSPFVSPYTLESLQADGPQVRACFVLDADAPLFAAHFPGNPILPGVVQIDMVAKVIAACPEWQMGEADIDEVANVKYLHIIDPRVHTKVYISVNCKPSADGRRHFRATLTSDVTDGAIHFSSISLVMRSQTSRR